MTSSHLLSSCDDVTTILLSSCDDVIILISSRTAASPTLRAPRSSSGSTPSGSTTRWSARGSPRGPRPDPRPSARLGSSRESHRGGGCGRPASKLSGPRGRRAPLQVMDSWFGAQASSSRPGALAAVRALMAHDQWSITNPNKVRALVGRFCMANLDQFHAGAPPAASLLPPPSFIFSSSPNLLPPPPASRIPPGGG
jgi:hypothetical protein